MTAMLKHTARIDARRIKRGRKRRARSDHEKAHEWKQEV